MNPFFLYIYFSPFLLFRLKFIFIKIYGQRRDREIMTLQVCFFFILIDYEIEKARLEEKFLSSVWMTFESTQDTLSIRKKINNLVSGVFFSGYKIK